MELVPELSPLTMWEHSEKDKKGRSDEDWEFFGWMADSQPLIWETQNTQQQRSELKQASLQKLREQEECTEMFKTSKEKNPTNYKSISSEIILQSK